MSERVFKEECYAYFSNKYKEAVKEINKKHSDFYNLQEQIWNMKNHIALLEYALLNSKALPVDYGVIRND